MNEKDDYPERLEMAFECRKKGGYQEYRNGRTYCKILDKDCLYKEKCADGYRCFLLERRID